MTLSAHIAARTSSTVMFVDSGGSMFASRLSQIIDHCKTDDEVCVYVPSVTTSQCPNREQLMCWKELKYAAYTTCLSSWLLFGI